MKGSKGFVGIVTHSSGLKTPTMRRRAVAARGATGWWRRVGWRRAGWMERELGCSDELSAKTHVSFSSDKCAYNVSGLEFSLVLVVKIECLEGQILKRFRSKRLNKKLEARS